MHCFKLIGATLALVAASLQVWASPGGETDAYTSEQDTAILFRFVPGNRIFYSPYRGNDEAIRLAAQLIERHRAEIESGKAYVLIRGFCGSFPTRQENLAAAKERSNHVKSWFIVHHGMKEEYYRTGNSTYSYKGIKDVVALVGLRYAEPAAGRRAASAPAARQSGRPASPR